MSPVRLTTRPSRDGQRFTFVLEFRDAENRRRRVSLGHDDRARAEQQCRQLEQDLLTGAPLDGPLAARRPLGAFWADSRRRTRGQIRESTLTEQDIAMRHFMETCAEMQGRRPRRRGQGPRELRLGEVQLKHAERFVQDCLRRGNAPATVLKKIKALKRVFALAVQRGQIDANPFAHARCPKGTKPEIRVYQDDECRRLLTAARWHRTDATVPWELLVSLALATGMRRGELLNLCWADIDVPGQTARVAPKADTPATWLWLIKDAERRTLPLTEDVLGLVVDHQQRQRPDCPYVLVPPDRYDRIQERRTRQRWTHSDGRCPVNNFTRRFEDILERAQICDRTFHDLRRTCITRWFAQGLSVPDVMRLAGHSDMQTTQDFYAAVSSDLLERARQASTAAMAGDGVTHLARAPVTRAAEPQRGVCNA